MSKDLKDKTLAELERIVTDLGDAERIEAVLLRDEQRQTLCVSTQVGCAMRCSFCATGRIKLSRLCCYPANGLSP